MTESIRVLVVDDHEVFATSLAAVLDAQPGIRTVGVAGTAQSALDLAETETPDVILLDQRLPDGEGIALIKPLLRIRPTAHIVMVTASSADHILIAAMEAGAIGFVDKTRSLADLIDSVRGAASGECLINPRMLARLLPRLLRRGNGPATVITDREREVLTHIVEGLSNAGIATRMSISVNSVRHHIVDICAKLGAHSKLEARTIALDTGLVAMDPQRSTA